MVDNQAFSPHPKSFRTGGPVQLEKDFDYEQFSSPLQHGEGLGQTVAAG